MGRDVAPHAGEKFKCVGARCLNEEGDSGDAAAIEVAHAGDSDEKPEEPCAIPALSEMLHMAW
jgi:hypothetical protein